MNIDDSVNLDDLAVTELEPSTWYGFVQAQIDLEGYLTHVLDTCDSYCSELNKAIEMSNPSIVSVR